MPENETRIEWAETDHPAWDIWVHYEVQDNRSLTPDRWRLFKEAWQAGGDLQMAVEHSRLINLIVAKHRQADSLRQKQFDCLMQRIEVLERVLLLEVRKA